MIDIRTYVRTYVRSPLLRMRDVTRKRSRPAGQIGNRFSPAESAFSACDRDRVSPAESAFLVRSRIYMYIHGDQISLCHDDDLGLQTRGRRAFPPSARLLGARVNSKRGYGSAKTGVQISALSNRGYGIGDCTPLLDIVCVTVISK